MRAVPRYNNTLNELNRQINVTKYRAVRLVNRKHISLPVYNIAPNEQDPIPPPVELDALDPPDEPVEGQLALNYTGVLYWYLLGEWRTCPNYPQF